MQITRIVSNVETETSYSTMSVSFVEANMINSFAWQRKISDVGADGCLKWYTALCLHTQSSVFCFWFCCDVISDCVAEMWDQVSKLLLCI